MTFLALPTALIAASIAVPILVAMYFLKLRRREMKVSSTLLWKRAVQDLQVNAPFQKMRRNLLLLLQLLILLALLIAMARPTLSGQGSTGRRLIVVIDHSASMNAGDVTPTRLDRAKDLARRLIADASSAPGSSPGSATAGSAAGGPAGGEASGGVMIVAFAQQARVVQPFTSDPALLRRAIDDIPPTDQLSRLAPAIALVEPFALSTDDRTPGTRIVVISDGRVIDSDAINLRGGDLRFLRVAPPDDRAIDNLAIVSLAARRDFARPQRVEVFARLANFGPAEVEAALTLTLDGRTQRVARASVPAFDAANQAPGSRSLRFELVVTGEAVIGLSHDRPDPLAADDSAFLVLGLPRQVRVALISPGNAFLEKAIESAGVRGLTRMTPKRYEDQTPNDLRRSPGDGGDDEGFDVLVFDGYSPTDAPPVDSLYFNAVPPIPGLTLAPWAEGQGLTQAVLDWRRDSDLLRYVTLDDVRLARPGRLALPDGSTVLATGPHGPIMAEITRDGVRHALVSFDVLQSNWPIQVGFAVFLSNAVQSLPMTAGQGGLAFQPGMVTVVPVADSVTKVSYDGPEPLRATVDRGRAVLPMFERVGLYRSAPGSGVIPPWDQIAVNLADPTESDLRPADRLEVGTVAARAESGSTVIRREVWRWFVWAALAVLVLEWIVYTRRMHL